MADNAGERNFCINKNRIEESVEKIKKSPDEFPMRPEIKLVTREDFDEE